MQPDSQRLPASPQASREQFLSLFLKSEREIYRYVAALVPNPSDADDIVQQTAVALWEKHHEYDASRPFTPWACRFALNKARQWIDRRQRWKTLLENGLAEELAIRRSELQPEWEAKLSHLDRCLGELPDRQRSLVEGFYFRREDIETLAKNGRQSVAAAYKTLQRIRMSLQACVDAATAREETV